ncbi:hypothetical protein HAX54_052888, partial [Datura stramonium]|nr:hypothetical protein [Datura stramonium]
ISPITSGVTPHPLLSPSSFSLRPDHHHRRSIVAAPPLLQWTAALLSSSPFSQAPPRNLTFHSLLRPSPFMRHHPDPPHHGAEPRPPQPRHLLRRTRPATQSRFLPVTTIDILSRRFCHQLLDREDDVLWQIHENLPSF